MIKQIKNKICWLLLSDSASQNVYTERSNLEVW